MEGNVGMATGILYYKFNGKPARFGGPPCRCQLYCCLPAAAARPSARATPTLLLLLLRRSLLPARAPLLAGRVDTGRAQLYCGRLLHRQTPPLPAKPGPASCLFVHTARSCPWFLVILRL